jgi:rfaE bifunctional protein nucleotidyltransferase chain/domain
MIKLDEGATRVRAAEKILTLQRAYEVVDDLKRRAQRIVFTNGCFDLLHPGHTLYLSEARKLGDVLIVALNSDRSVRTLKGPGRPLQPEADRAEILAGLEAVDYVTIFDEITPQEVIARMLPHVLVKGDDWPQNEIVGKKEVEAAGGRVVSIPRATWSDPTSKETGPLSTTAIIRTALKNFGQQR